MNKTGFTLIELLVVVLIIGILTSIALPQYQTAVDKAHLATYLPFAAQVRNAQNVYLAANGEYAESLDDLDIGFDVAAYCSGKFQYSGAWYAWNCKYGFGLDNYNSGREKVFYIYFCPSQHNINNGSSGPCWSNTVATIEFYYGTHPDYPNGTRCTYTNARGRRLCSFLN